MSERLKRADHLAELHTRLQIRQRHVERLRSGAEHLGAQTRASAVEDAVEQSKAVVERAEHRSGFDFDVREFEIRVAAAVERVEAPARKTFRFRRHEEQRDARGVAGRTARARGNHERGRGHAFRHERFRAAQA